MKNWIATYFRGGYLKATDTMTKKQAYNFMMRHVDGYYIEKVKGLLKVKTIFKHSENQEDKNG